MEKPHGLHILIYPDGQLLDATGPAQIFTGANAALGRAAYDVSLVAEAPGPIQMSGGLKLVAERDLAWAASDARTRPGTTLITGGQPGLWAALAAPKLIAHLADMAASGRRMVSVCSGALLLARAGVLDGRAATTHWRHLHRLRKDHPSVRVDDDRLFVRDGNVWTSAGVTAGIDLALAMVEADHGPNIALAVARDHVVLRVRPGGQRQYRAPWTDRRVGHGPGRRLAQAILEAPHLEWTIEEMAAEVGCSPRSLSRILPTDTGLSPSAFVETLRLELAMERILAGREQITGIADSCGFGSTRRLERAFARRVGCSPHDYRARFQSEGADP
jgi:transcriptional regulator GlxA family with amidase domain